MKRIWDFFPRNKNIEWLCRIQIRISINIICSCDSDADTIGKILQELIIKEDIEVDSAEEVAIKHGAWSEFSGLQNIFLYWNNRRQ